MNNKPDHNNPSRVHKNSGNNEIQFVLVHFLYFQAIILVLIDWRCQQSYFYCFLKKLLSFLYTHTFSSVREYCVCDVIASIPHILLQKQICSFFFYIAMGLRTIELIKWLIILNCLCNCSRSPISHCIIYNS